MLAFPSLSARTVLKDWIAVLDFDNSVPYVHKRYQDQLQVDESGHFLIEHMDDLQLVKDNIKNSYFTSSDTERYEAVEKIYRATGYKLDISMKRFFKMQKKVTQKLINRTVSKLIEF